MKVLVDKIFLLVAILSLAGNQGWADQKRELAHRLDNRTAPNFGICASALAASAGLAFCFKMTEQVLGECMKGDLSFALFLPITVGLAVSLVALPVGATRGVFAIREMEIFHLLKQMKASGVRLDEQFTEKYRYLVPPGRCQTTFNDLAEAGETIEGG